MTGLWIAALALIMLGIAYQMGTRQSRAVATIAGQRLHSRPQYHGALVALWAIAPLAVVLLGWALLSDRVARWFIDPLLPGALVAAGGNDYFAAYQRIVNIASGFGVAGTPEPWETQAGTALANFNFYGLLLVIGLATLTGAALAWRALATMQARSRARNQVERVVLAVLVLCSVVAVVTTLGIVFSLLAETLRFFTFVTPGEFLFGTVWQPRYSTTTNEAVGGYGMLPLLWGTLSIAFIAMLVSIPIGLMTAVYLSQYAPKRVRNVIKPVIEVLAGIPTIVYGFFALVTVGPFLRDTGAALGLTINATSALTAGVVMGVMIIPFISSLSDDVIRQVPAAMRDGSLGLGATKSETIRKVILPAALPGIVGAILLAVSRAIGETMIVVLAAGNSPLLQFDPTQATSTFTVTIVAQLTGDSDFASPQSLVAFALGFTLFFLTLLLNVGALFIVRKYREQYE